MMAAAVGGEEGLAATLRTVEHARQIDTRFSDEPAAELQRETGRRERFGAVAQSFVKRGGHFVDVERLLPGEARNIEAAAEVQLGKRHSKFVGNFAGAGDDRLVRVAQGGRIEALRRGEDVQAPPV